MFEYGGDIEVEVVAVVDLSLELGVQVADSVNPGDQRRYECDQLGSSDSSTRGHHSPPLTTAQLGRDWGANGEPIADVVLAGDNTAVSSYSDGYESSYLNAN